MPIDTDKLSARYRAQLVDAPRKRILLSKIEGSAQEPDLKKRPNTAGLGRVHHFRRAPSKRWIENPLPIDPACAYLGMPRQEIMTAQVFQNAACNWRCWYCYVPFDMLGAQAEKSQWATVEELVNAYADLPDRPLILDLSGGQPELTPEWVLWTMECLQRRGIATTTYLWSDDYFWRYLTETDREQIVSYPGYGKVGCFKGFDEESFAFNTEAPPTHFDRQFELFKRYFDEGLDIYSYITFTHIGKTHLKDAMERLVERLQRIDETLPARTVPLEIAAFGPVHDRLDEARRWAMDVGQYKALDEWQTIVSRRLSNISPHV
jgi:uncharacterized Fe-S cluster-containing radical SAM superfamily protein